MEIAQLYDLAEPPVGAELDASALVGEWVNSNADTRSIARLTIFESDGKLLARVFGIGPKGLIDWGEAELEIFSSSPSSSTPSGFTGYYDFGFAETEIKGMIMKGLLVFAQFHRFKDDSQRADYFVREYFSLFHGKF
ncbi:MAG TPA: hypothetical protein VGJ66_16575 [Pyrinomonadaceae bacterium]|jgi:hypothetical protein